MKQLTKAEEEIMQILWDKKEATVREMMENIEGFPAYNTVSTIVRILEKKGFVDHKSTGKTHIYFPKVSKEAYRDKFMKKVVRNYFRNSWKEVVSFFNKSEDMTIADLEEMQAMIQDEINRKKDLS